MTGFPVVQQIKLPGASRTLLILPVAQVSRIREAYLIEHDAIKHPESAQLTAPGPTSLLYPFRQRTANALATVSQAALKKVYEVGVIQTMIPLVDQRYSSIIS
jgi:hypothetical protein